MKTENIKISQDVIAQFCQKWNVQELALFGSVLRDDFREESDIDVLVSFSDDATLGLWELAEMQDELETLFGRKIDLVEKEALQNPIRKRNILTSSEVLYAA
jgi:predicted nucleotidyltransferase